MVRACVVVGDRDYTWASPISGYRGPEVPHAWATRAPGESVINQAINLPPPVFAPSYLYGFTGFDTDLASRNQRVSLKDFTVTDGKASVKLTTCKFIL